MTTDPADGGLVPLGDGPAARVLAGVDSATGAAYAVKVLPAPLDPHVRAGIEAELAALAEPAAGAPILVADGLVELGKSRQGLRMELCSQSLPELIEAFGPLSVTEAVALGTALAEALAAAHAAGVLHGGVTPGNVLFRESGEPVLADFGLTLRRPFPAGSAQHRDFMAPETRRDGTIDERSDLYGLGAVLHLALTGRPPPVRDDLPPALAPLLTSLLAEDPALRPADAATVVKRLTVAAEPVAPQPAGAPLVVFGPRRRSPLRVLPGLAAVLVVVAVAALFWLNRPDDLAMPAGPAVGVASASALGPSRPAVVLELTDVTDRGDVVDLAWRSSEPLTFAVMVAGDDGSSRTLLAQRATTFSVPVDPVRRYCFLVQGTNGVQIYASAPEGIREATCKG
jgi:hypothetical protein